MAGSQWSSTRAQERLKSGSTGGGRSCEELQFSSKTALLVLPSLQLQSSFIKSLIVYSLLVFLQEMEISVPGWRSGLYPKRLQTFLIPRTEGEIIRAHLKICLCPNTAPRAEVPNLRSVDRCWSVGHLVPGHSEKRFQNNRSSRLRY